MIGRALAALAILVAGTAGASEPPGLHDALAKLAAAQRYSGAVVVREGDEVRFARAYGFADPFAGRPFTVDTPVDSASLAKPVTAAAALALALDGEIEIDAPAKRYVREFPYPAITVRQLLSHSAGLALKETKTGLAGRSNLDLINAARKTPLLFAAGSRFSYCNLCTIVLAELVERVSGRTYLHFAHERLWLPAEVGIRPGRLADWKDRAIGHRRTPAGKIERFDSWEGERFYGSANLSISARQMADWGARWWQAPAAPIRSWATADAVIGGKLSGLTLGNWYCAADKRRCHYLGHHEGFHHLLYWDSRRKLSIAMVSNNAVDPGLIPRLQRSIIAFAEGRAVDGGRELDKPLSGSAPAAGAYRLASGERVEITGGKGRQSLVRGGIAYPAYPVGPAIRYVPGLDAYLAGAGPKAIRLLTLHADEAGSAIR